MILSGFAIAERAVADTNPDKATKNSPPKRTVTALKDLSPAPEPR